MFIEVLSPLQQEFKSCHDMLSNLHPKSMLRLEKPGIIPSIFIDLKDDVTHRVSCMFGTARRKQWITKGNKSGSIRKDNENKPGD